MEEIREQQEELKRKIEEESQKKLQQADNVKKSSNEDAPTSKHNELVKQFEKLIGGAIAKVPVVATPKITRTLTAGKSGDSSEKTNKSVTLKPYIGFLLRLPEIHKYCPLCFGV